MPAIAQTSQCRVSLPLSAATLGIVAADGDCTRNVQWGFRAGAAAFGYQRWTPFVRAHGGITYPPRPIAAAPSTREATDWSVTGLVQYVFLTDTAFDTLNTLSDGPWYNNPSLQQWSLLSESDISLELKWKRELAPSLGQGFALKLWQTLPPQWRSVGALRHTRNSDLNGISVHALFQENRWQGRIGIGRMTFASDQLAATFFYPTFEVSYELMNTPWTNTTQSFEL